MGEIVVELGLENFTDRANFLNGIRAEADIRRARVLGVVDPGARMLALPEAAVRQPGLRTVRTVETNHADGRRGELPVAATVTVSIGDRQMQTDCLVLPDGAEPLAGQVVLEVLDLLADCGNLRLIPRPESSNRPLMRL